MSKSTEMMTQIAKLYRKSWFDTALLGYVQGFLDGYLAGSGRTVSHDECIKAFQVWLYISEDDANVESLKRQYHRVRDEFYTTIRKNEIVIAKDDESKEVFELKNRIKNLEKALEGERKSKQGTLL